MRVLHLIAGKLYGGVETFVSLVARRPEMFPQMKHEFGLNYPGRLHDELRGANATLYDLGAIRTSRPWSVLSGRRRLGQLLLRSRPDVAVTHMSWPHAIYAPVLRREGVPTIYYLHGPIRFMSWLDRWASWHVPNLMIAVSQDTLRSGRQLYPRTPAEVLNYPMPIDAVSLDDESRIRFREQFQTPPGDVVLLQASRLDPWKGHRQLIQALALLNHVHGWVAWIAGGPQREREVKYLATLRNDAERLGVASRIRFIGERRDIPKVLGAADVLCQANEGPEGFSLAFMEAFAAGLPIVTTRIGGAPEMIDERTGKLVAPGDTHAFAEAIRELIASPVKRAAMGDAAKHRVRELCEPAARLADLCNILRNVAQSAADRHRP